MLEDVHVERHVQGHGWYRESDQGVQDAELYLDDFIKPFGR